MINVSETNTQISVRLEESWRKALAAEFNSEYLLSLKKFLVNEKSRGKKIYPRGDEIFAALNLTPLESVKVVIIGQDPYHGPGQAHGLCFSVRDKISPPPSLVNIFKEMRQDLGVEPPASGDLTSWAQQGVLLLNAVLTVEDGQPNSHKDKGWEKFTDRIVEILDSQRSGLVFILWGSYAQKKGAFINRDKHLVIESPHPSPLSAHRGFLGSRPFSKANNYLIQKKKSPVDWRLNKSL